MFCTKCGAQVEPGVKFCSKCGAPIEAVQQPAAQNAPQQAAPNQSVQQQGYAQQPQQPVYPQQPQQPKVRKPINKGILAGIGGVVVVVAVVLILVLTHRTKVSLNDYVVFSENGYDGYGNCYAYIDYDALLSENAKAFGLKSDNMDTTKALTAYSLLESSISGSLDTNGGLSNGDTVNYIWTVDADALEDQYKIKLKYSDVAHEVAELTALTEVDPFADFTVTASGYDGNGSIYWEQNGNYYFDITADKTDSLSNGDTVTFTVSDDYEDDAYRAEYYGIKLSTKTYTYTVEGLDALQDYDPFDYLIVQYYGTSNGHQGSIGYTFSDDTPYWPSVSVDKTDDLSNGDTVTFTLDEDYYGDEMDSYFASYGLHLTATSREVTLDGFSEYVTSIDQISQESIDLMKSKEEDLLNSYKESYENDSDYYADILIKSIKYEGMYLLTPVSDDTYDSYGTKNILYIVYSMELPDDTVYFYISYDNLEVDSTGALQDFYEDYYDHPYYYDDYVTVGNFNVAGYKSLKAFKAAEIDTQADTFLLGDSVTAE